MSFTVKTGSTIHTQTSVQNKKIKPNYKTCTQNILSIIAFATEMKILNITAHQKPLTENPSTILSIIIKIHALITRIKRPSVKMVSGSVRNTMTGLMNVLIMASNMATPTAVQKLLILTPSNK